MLKIWHYPAYLVMAFDVRPYIRLRRSQRSFIYGIITLSLIFGLIWNYSRPKSVFRSSNRRTFDVFDPVYGIFPGQRSLSGQSPGIFKWCRLRKLSPSWTPYIILPSQIRFFVENWYMKKHSLHTIIHTYSELEGATSPTLLHTY